MKLLKISGWPFFGMGLMLDQLVFLLGELIGQFFIIIFAHITCVDTQFSERESLAILAYENPLHENYFWEI